MAFVSLYFHSLDAKNRLFIPAKYREQLGETFYIVPGAEQNLYVYTNEEFERLSTQVLEKRDRAAQRAFFSNAYEATTDKQGRVTLDAKHVDFAGLSKETAIVGAGRRVEIWSLDKYTEKEKTTSETINYDDFDF